MDAGTTEVVRKTEDSFQNAPVAPYSCTRINDLLRPFFVPVELWEVLGGSAVLPLLLLQQCGVAADKRAQMGAVSPSHRQETVIGLGFLLCMAIKEQGSLAQGYGF